MIRPSSFDSFFGQKDVVDYLRIAVKSVHARGAILGHMMLLGPAGVGKTTLAASVLPTEVGCPVQSLNCAAIARAEDLTRKLAVIPGGSILFLDEIHALIPEAREHLLTVLEDSTLTVSLPDKDPMVVTLPRFTVIGATTRVGSLDAPLRGRFKHTLRLNTYTDEEMQEVIRWLVTGMDDIEIEDDAITQLVAPTHGIARTAVTLLEACVDTIYGEGRATHTISREVVADTLRRLGYVMGLTNNEVRYLKALDLHRGRVGLTTLAAILDETQQTIEEVYEPYLLREGFIEKTPTGRKLAAVGVGVLTYL